METMEDFVFFTALKINLPNYKDTMIGHFSVYPVGEYNEIIGNSSHSKCSIVYPMG